MECPKCKGNNVNFQAVSIVKTSGKGCLYWLFIDLWLEPFIWLFFTIPMLFIKLFSGSRNIKTQVKSYGVCQECGHKWKA